MAVSLIHIGLPKTASTSMQHAWLHSPGVYLVKDDLVSIINLASQCGNTGLVGKRFDVRFDLTPPEGAKVIFSNEGLGASYLYGQGGGCLGDFHQAASIMLAQVAPGAKVLLVLRQPEKWLLSVYNQLVKMGGTYTFPEYQRVKGEVLARSWDLGEVVGAWEERFGCENVFILPMEMLRDNADLFWSEIEAFSGVPLPPLEMESIPELDKNKSLNESALKIMREYNKWLELFRQNKEVVIHQDAQAAFDIVRFEVRYNLQMYPEKIVQAFQPLAEKLPSCLADEQHFDRDLLVKMKGHVADFFDKTDFYGYREQYISMF
ncbi:hypothetical protein ACFL5J_01330 [Thermodesulfobacteriota bacterium]